ncbi:MAG: rod shape-determining protein MreD [Lachnospiraceae bacterium]|nr:rod shape-determining protein MreD [Lachnospiraceae bacterium]MCI9184478.1 rod shape-determining protein MreD [Lachnospiraceae bacterium]
MRRIGLNILLMLLAFTIQSGVFPLLPFLAATPNLLLILTFSFGFIYGKSAGLWYGLLAGILLDLFYSGPFGFYTLLFIHLGYFNGICTKYYYEDYITLPLILSLINEVAYNCYIYVFRFLIRNKLDFFFYFREIILPEMIFTTVATLLLYRSFLFTNRRLEELEKRRD